MQISLTYQEKLALESRHKKCSDKRECDRIKAILLSDGGWSSEMISQSLRKHQTSIIRHLHEYSKHQKTTSNNGGSDSYLDNIQTELVIKHLSDITYFHMHDIREYIKEIFDVDYSISGLQKWLHRNGFSYKQFKGVPHKYDQEKQDDFIAEYNELKVSAASDEPILFIDATHPTQATKVSCGWIRTGVDKAIETTDSRTGFNIVGAIRLGYLQNTITKQYTTNLHIHLALDGAGYHRSDVVKVAAKELGIILHYLPPYSPNLKPIERLWKAML